MEGCGDDCDGWAQCGGGGGAPLVVLVEGECQVWCCCDGCCVPPVCGGYIGRF